MFLANIYNLIESISSSYNVWSAVSGDIVSECGLESKEMRALFPEVRSGWCDSRSEVKIINSEHCTYFRSKSGGSLYWFYRDRSNLVTSKKMIRYESDCGFVALRHFDDGGCRGVWLPKGDSLQLKARHDEWEKFKKE